MGSPEARECAGRLGVPGSTRSRIAAFLDPDEALNTIDRDDEIIIHCPNPSWRASVALYQFLERNGYRNLRRFAGSPEE